MKRAILKVVAWNMEMKSRTILIWITFVCSKKGSELWQQNWISQQLCGRTHFELQKPIESVVKFKVNFYTNNIVINFFNFVKRPFHSFLQKSNLFELRLSSWFHKHNHSHSSQENKFLPACWPARVEICDSCFDLSFTALCFNNAFLLYAFFANIFQNNSKFFFWCLLWEWVVIEGEQVLKIGKKSLTKAFSIRLSNSW